MDWTITFFVFAPSVIKQGECVRISYVILYYVITDVGLVNQVAMFCDILTTIDQANQSARRVALFSQSHTTCYFVVQSATAIAHKHTNKFGPKS